MWEAAAKAEHKLREEAEMKQALATPVFTVWDAPPTVAMSVVGDPNRFSTDAIIQAARQRLGDCHRAVPIVVSGADAYGETVKENVLATLPDAREMDLRNMRALLDQKDAQIEALRSDLSAALMAGAKVDDVLSRMTDENRTLTQQVEILTRQIQGNAPAPKPEPVPHNPWGKRHDGRAPDVGAKR